MLALVRSGAVAGVEGYGVNVEVDLASGLPQFNIVGLPDTAVKESRDRVRAAIRNTGFEFPLQRITVNLAPADIRKEGSSFDLPMAIGILIGEEVLGGDAVAEYMLIGELSFDGSVRPVRGVLPIALAARQGGCKGFIVPAENAREAAVVEGLRVYPVRTLPQVVEFLRGTQAIEAAGMPEEIASPPEFGPEEDLAEVRGQDHAKRALEIAASGGHNLLFVGPPGSGKTMLARRLPGILPPMRFEEALEASEIHSIVGLLTPERPLLTRRSFRAPHHTISDAGLIGGGATPRPGEVTLAHQGVLFLDELPEFHRHVLEVLRQPLEEGRVTIGRASGSITFPARVMLVAAMNPCPCGYLGDRVRPCICTPIQVRRYRGRISGPLLDRIDLQVFVPGVTGRELAGDGDAISESSSTVRERVAAARTRQQGRYDGMGIACNAQLKGRILKKYAAPDAEGRRLLEVAVERLGLSARAYHRILRVARTIADLAGREQVTAPDIAEAIGYRSLDRTIPA